MSIVGNVHEGLLALAAVEGKGEIGQFFTPRALTDAMVAVTLPTAKDTVMDPACGTGGFLVAARAHVLRRAADSLASGESRFEPEVVVRGVELVPFAARLAAVNLLLHGPSAVGDEPTIRIGNALTSQPGEVSLVLTHPPFGVRSPITARATGDRFGWDGLLRGQDALAFSRRDFVATTANRPLMFLQHVASLLKPGGRAAVVVPDNILFAAGDGEKVRRHLLAKFDVHTLLRLPASAVLPAGLRANVLFFDRPDESRHGTPCTRRLWVYEQRSERSSRAKHTALQRDAFDDFVAFYLPGRDHDEREETERFKAFAYEDLIARDAANLDLWWDEDLAEEECRAPHVIAEEIVNDLSVALSEFSAIADTLRARHAEAEDGW
jgi:type I restriction enzyme M protein